MLEDVNDEIPLFTEREQETVLEGEPIGTKVTQVNAIDKDGTFPNNQVSPIDQRRRVSIIIIYDIIAQQTHSNENLVYTLYYRCCAAVTPTTTIK